MIPEPPEPEPRSACEANTSAQRPGLGDPSASAQSPPVAPDDTCLLCGGPMYGVHCKLVCANCGYREDCSDLFPGD